MKARFIWEVRLVMIHVKQSLFFRLHLSVRTRLETCVRRRGGLAVSRTEFVVLLMLALLITFLLIKARVLMVFETLVFRTFAVLSVTVLSVEAVLSITFFAFEMLLALLAVSFPFVLLSILAVEAVLWLLLAFRHAVVTSSDSRAIGLVGRCRLSVFLHHGILVASWSAAFFCIEESDTVIAAGIGDFIRSDGFRSHSSSSFCLLGFLFAVLRIVLGPISLLLLGHLRREHEIVSRRFSGENGISCKSGCGKHSCGRYHDDVFLQVSHNESILSEANLYMHSVRVLGGAERKGFHDIGIIVSTKSNNGKRLLLGNQD